jgi:hypothetical protein
MSKSKHPGVRRTLDEARSAKEPAREVFERLGEVAGIGITRCGEGYGLKVNLKQCMPAGVAAPAEIKGVPVKVEVVGPLKKRAAGK